jgi:hypothetical protein
MKSNVSAHLCYGFLLPDENRPKIHPPLPSWLRKDNAYISLEEFILDIWEIVLEPLPQIPEGTPPFYSPCCTPAEQSLWKKSREIEMKNRMCSEKAAANAGIELICHNHNKSREYILAAAGSNIQAYAGQVIALGQQLQQELFWRSKLEIFCQRANIPFIEPQWLLCAYTHY